MFSSFIIMELHLSSMNNNVSTNICTFQSSINPVCPDCFPVIVCGLRPPCRDTRGRGTRRCRGRGHCAAAAPGGEAVAAVADGLVQETTATPPQALAANLSDNPPC